MPGITHQFVPKKRVQESNQNSIKDDSLIVESQKSSSKQAAQMINPITRNVASMATNKQDTQQFDPDDLDNFFEEMVKTIDEE